MNLVSLKEYKNRELVAVLKGLLELAEDGAAQGLSFVVKLGRDDHRAGVAGDYRRHPEEALSATFRMERHLMKEQAAFETSDFKDSVM